MNKYIFILNCGTVRIENFNSDENAIAYARGLNLITEDGSKISRVENNDGITLFNSNEPAPWERS
jgi:hypothetical protein